MVLSIKKFSSGFTLIEALLSIAIMMVLIIGALSASSLASSSVILTQDRNQANLLAQEAMEAIQAIRATKYSSLTVGNFYPNFGEGGWDIIPGTQVIGKFTRYINISSVFRNISCGTVVCGITSEGGILDENTKLVKVYVTWAEASNNKEIFLSTIVTYWK